MRMQKILALVLCFALVCSMAAVGFSSAAADDSLPETLLNFDFSTFTGQSQFTDTTNHLTVDTSGIHSASGILNGENSAVFSGAGGSSSCIAWAASDYNPLALADNGVTISMWVYAYTTASWRTIFAMGKNSGTRFLMEQGDSRGFQTENPTDISAKEESFYSTFGSNYVNNWKMLTFTQDADGNVTVYEDGAAVTTTQDNMTAVLSNIASYYNDNGYYTVGGASNGTISLNGDKGTYCRMASFTIYDGALTADQVSSVYGTVHSAQISSIQSTIQSLGSLDYSSSAFTQVQAALKNYNALSAADQQSITGADQLSNWLESYWTQYRASSNVLLDLDFSGFTGQDSVTDTTGHLTVDTGSVSTGTGMVSGESAISLNGSEQAVPGSYIFWSSADYNPIALADNGVTMNFWIYTNNLHTWSPFFALGYDGSNRFLLEQGGNSNLQTEIPYSIGSKTVAKQESFYSTFGSNYVGTWKMLTVTQDASGNFTAYEDGVAVTSNTFTTLYELANDYLNNSTYFLGGPGLLSGNAGLNGKMARFTIYDGALSAEAVSTIYAEQEPVNHAITQTIELIDAIGTVDANSLSAITAAETAYAALSGDQKTQVTNYATLTAARAAYDALLSPEQIEANAVIMQISALGTVTYKSKDAIAAARAAYAGLSEAAKAYVTNLSTLETAETALAQIYSSYKATLDNWTASIGSWSQTDGFNTTPWMRSGLVSAADMTATLQAIADEAYYQYKNNVYNVGFQSTGNIGNWDALQVQCEASVSDNIASPWSGSRRVSFIDAAFPGIAFSTTGYMAGKNDRNNAELGNSFAYNGRIYQQFWGYVASYDASVPPVDGSSEVDYQTQSIYPGKGSTQENVFKYAYAKYNMDNKWDNQYLGLVDGDVVTAGVVEYQKINSDSGVSYLLSDTARNAAVTLSSDASGYMDQIIASSAYVISGSLAQAFGANTASLSALGAITSVTADTVTFANGTLTASGVILSTADYTAVNTAIAAVPTDLSVYTDATAAAVQTAVSAVDWDKSASEQSAVNAYADAINQAVAGLILKTLEMNVSISEGMVSAGATDGKYDITWNATIATGDGATISGINSNVIFKEYGVYYATGDEVLADYAHASADQIRQKVFAQGENINVYTMFGFRLKNVSASAVRAAMFYVEYEYDGHTYIVLSTADEVIATIAE